MLDRIKAMEAEKDRLASALDRPAPSPVRLHPNMAEVYRAKVARLVEALNDEHDRIEAAEIIRGLVDRIVLTPKDENGRQTLSIDLEGALAGILALATNKQEAAGGQRPRGNNVGCGGRI